MSSELADVHQLMKERDEIERKIEAEYETLRQNRVDMETSLVDEQDFPRNDIDVMAVRLARVEIIRLKNDHNVKTALIEELMGKIHNSQKPSEPVVVEAEKPVHRTTNRPILKINDVTPGSPADEGGLKQDDLVIQFAHLHGDNFTGLDQLAEVTKSHLGKTLKVTVLRDVRVHRLQFSPRQWAGQGIFGASFLPISSSQIL